MFVIFVDEETVAVNKRTDLGSRKAKEPSPLSSLNAITEQTTENARIQTRSQRKNGQKSVEQTTESVRMPTRSRKKTNQKSFESVSKPWDQTLSIDEDLNVNMDYFSRVTRHGNTARNVIRRIMYFMDNKEEVDVKTFNVSYVVTPKNQSFCYHVCINTHASSVGRCDECSV